MMRRVSSDLSDARLLLEELRIAASSDGASPRSFALLLRRVSETEAWLEEFPSFRAYLTAPERKGGLELNETAFLHIAELGGEEKLARKLLHGELASTPRGAGRPKNNSTTVIRPGRETAGAVVAKLKRDDPELAEKVISGEVSAYAAAREKGWRRPRIVISTPERTAASLRKHMPAAARHALARLLLDEQDPT